MNERDVRADFPLLERYRELAYLDNAATTQKPQCVLDAVNEYYLGENSNPMRGLYDLSVKATQAYENARESVRDLIGAASCREIIFTRNATESLNLAASCLGRAIVNEGDEILITVSEHHSDLIPWQTAARERGAKLKYLECTAEGEYTVGALKAALSPRTKIFAFAAVSNVFGRANPVAEFAEVCHSNGTIVVCDGAQSVPHMKTDVGALGVDFLAFSGHKMYAPMGIGVLYGREELLEQLPPFLTGGEMIEYVTRDAATFAELPHRFEAGTVNAGGAVGLDAAIKYIRSVGIENIEKRERELTRYAFDRISGIPHVSIIGSPDPDDHHGIITFTVEGVHPHDIAALMDRDNIAVRAGHHCAQPLHQFLGVASTARMSLAFYNTEAEIDRFAESLSGLRRRMGYGE